MIPLSTIFMKKTILNHNVFIYSTMYSLKTPFHHRNLKGNLKHVGENPSRKSCNVKYICFSMNFIGFYFIRHKVQASSDW